MIHRPKGFRGAKGVTVRSDMSPFDQIRSRKGLTFDDIAALAGVSRKSCRKLKHMRPQELYSMPLGTLLRICMLLRVSPVKLIPMLGYKPKNILRLRQRMGDNLPIDTRDEDCGPIVGCEEGSEMTGEVTPDLTSEDFGLDR